MSKLTISLFLLLLFSLVGAKENNEYPINFSEAEKEWIKDHPVIRVANETDWPPFDFNESGVAKGLSIDHIKLLAHKVGIKIEFVHGYPWTELVARFKQRKIDVMPVFYINEERKKFTLYTQPYYRGKLGIFTNTENNTWSISLLDKRVGMETSHGSIPLVKQKIPGIVITEVDHKIELVRKLATKQLDAIIGNPFVFYYIARENQIKNIQLSNFVSMSEEEQRETSLHIGIRNDWPMLHQILQKAMGIVTDKELAEIKSKWADITIVKKIDWVVVVQVSCVVILIVFFLLWHNRSLKIKVAAKTQALKRLNEGLESKVAKRTKKLTEVNIKLNQSIEELKTLRGIIPICASCKKIRDDSGYWNLLEAYITKHSLAEFSHSICPDCAKRIYPEIYEEMYPE